MNKLPASTGLAWLKQGFSLFRQQPGMLTMLLFATMMFTLLLSNLPVIGNILSMALIPAFSMVILQSCRELENGTRITPAVLLTGFRAGAAGPLLKLGLVYFGVAVVLGLAVTPFVDTAAIQQAFKTMQAKGNPTLPESTVFGLLAFGLLMSAAIISLSFAPPLTHWKKMPTFKSIFYSVFAVFGSLGPVVVMLLAWFGIFMVSFSIVMLLLGRTPLVSVVLMWVYLVFSANLQCAIYAAYRQLLPDTAESDAF